MPYAQNQGQNGKGIDVRLLVEFAHALRVHTLLGHALCAIVGVCEKKERKMFVGVCDKTHLS